MSLLAAAALVPLLALAGSPDALRMPPPPAGMKVLPSADPEVLLREAALRAGEDAPDGSPQVESASAELEELRALEAATLDPSARPSAELLQLLSRLGHGHPLRHALADALADGEWPMGSGALQVQDLASFDVDLIRKAYDIPVEMQPLVAQYIQFFQGPGRKWYRKWMSRSTRFLPMMQPILAAKGLPKDLVYLAMIESGFSAHAYSFASASGPWQFIPGTGKQYGLKQDFWVDERRDPVKSTHAAAKYLAQLHREFGHWYLAWAGYNTGGGRVRRLIEKQGTRDFWALSTEGKGLASETRHYVPKLIAAAIVSKHYQAFGFSEEEFEFQEPLAFEEAKLSHATDLEVAARAAGVELEALKDLNPELKRWCTPPASEDAPYLLRLPVGAKERFETELGKIPLSERLNFLVHRVKKGDTLSAIASRYGSFPEAVMRLNGLKSARTLKVNSDLVVPVAAKGTGAEAAARVVKRQAVEARKSGLSHRTEDEVPAGTPRPKAASAGTVKKETVDGRVRVTYGVAAGDTLWALSQRFDVSVDALRQWNRLSKKAKGLQVGTALVIWPGKKAALATAELPTSPVVSGGAGLATGRGASVR